MILANSSSSVSLVWGWYKIPSIPSTCFEQLDKKGKCCHHSCRWTPLYSRLKYLGVTKGMAKLPADEPVDARQETRKGRQMKEVTVRPRHEDVAAEGDRWRRELQQNALRACACVCVSVRALHGVFKPLESTVVKPCWSCWVERCHHWCV